MAPRRAAKSRGEKKTAEFKKPREPKAPVKEAANAQASQEAEKKKRKRKKPNSFKRYVFRVLREIYSDISISRSSMIIMDNFMHDIFERLARESAMLALHTKRNTLMIRDVEAATQLILTGDLAKHAAKVGMQAVRKCFVGN